MNLTVNGQKRSFPELAAESTVATLIESLGLKGDRVAIEQNGSIVPRTAWSAAALHEGDKLEVVHFVGGGRC